MLPVNDNQVDPWTGKGSMSWMASKGDIIYAFIQTIVGVFTKHLILVKQADKKRNNSPLGFLKDLLKGFTLPLSGDSVIHLIEYVANLFQPFAEKNAEQLASIAEEVMDLVNRVGDIFISGPIKKLILDNRDLRRIYIVFDYYSYDSKRTVSLVLSVTQRF